MKDISISAARPSAGNPGWWDRLARSLVFRTLGQMQEGRLQVEADGQVYEFGRESDDGLCARIVVHHPSAYRCFAFAGSVGAGEAYMHAGWSTPCLVSVIRWFARNLQQLNQMEGRWPLGRRLLERLLNLFRANTLAGARRNIAAHYDLSNDFFRLFLDADMMYSAAVYRSVDTSLEAASAYKLDLLCRKLQLCPSDHLLEIGTGWGGLALHAARHYGCRVTTTTISREQFSLARERVLQAGLEDRITVLLQDYRQLQGRYDKLVSVEMIEAVGAKYYNEYFRTCTKLLKPHGRMALQAITIPDQRYQSAQGSVDFIKKYIFPGGSLPSVAVMAECVRRDTDMTLTHLQDIGFDYALTLRDWRQRFLERLPQVRELGFDEVFCRMWDYYLAYCEGGFRERAISTVQVVLAKPAARDVGIQA